MLNVIRLLFIINVHCHISNKPEPTNSIMTAENNFETKWDESLANQVSFFFPKDCDSKSGDDGDTGDNDDERCILTFQEKTKMLKLVNKNSGAVLDRIYVEDIIGADIEFSFGTADSDGRNRDEKAVQGREHMISIETNVRAKLLAGGRHDDDDDDDDDVVHRKSLSPSSSSAYLNIYAYPKSAPSRGLLGQIKDCFVSNSGDCDDGDGGGDGDAEPNSRLGLGLGYRHEKHRKWKLQPTEDFLQAQTLVQSIRKVADLPSQSCASQKRYLVLVNPFSGTKQGQTTYDEIVKKMLNESGVQHDLLVTQYAGHASERMLRKQDTREYGDQSESKGEDGRGSSTGRDISEYDAIIMLGGDGIVSEVLAGLKKRTDYDAIMETMRFGVVGCGTSNGLAISLLHASKTKEKYSSLESTFLICRGRSSKADLSLYETKDERYTSFLTFSWAFIADVDIDSECIRFMGILRNDIWAVWRVLKLRTYKGTFSYLPVTDIDINTGSTDATSAGIDSFSAGADKGSDKGNEQNNSYPAWSDEKVPSNWVTMEEDFVLFWASQVTHAGTATFQSPATRLQDGVFNIMVIR